MHPAATLQVVHTPTKRPNGHKVIWIRRVIVSNFNDSGRYIVSNNVDPNISIINNNPGIISYNNNPDISINNIMVNNNNRNVNINPNINDNINDPDNINNPNIIVSGINNNNPNIIVNGSDTNNTYISVNCNTNPSVTCTCSYAAVAPTCTLVQVVMTRTYL